MQDDNKFYKVTSYYDFDPRCEIRMDDILDNATYNGHAYVHLTFINLEDEIEFEMFYHKQKLHSVDGKPAIIDYYDSNMVIEAKQWYNYGKLHRADGPAIERFDIEFDNNGNVHNTLLKHKCQWYLNDQYIGIGLYDKWPLSKSEQLEVKFKYG